MRMCLFVAFLLVYMFGFIFFLFSLSVCFLLFFFLLINSVNDNKDTHLK